MARTNGRIALLGAEGSERECSNDGRIFEIRNGGGRVEIDSFIRRSKAAFSPSDASSNASKLSTNSTRLFPAQNPIFSSSGINDVVASLVRGFGFSMRLNIGNRARGMAPAVAWVGAEVRSGNDACGL